MPGGRIPGGRTLLFELVTETYDDATGLRPETVDPVTVSAFGALEPLSKKERRQLDGEARSRARYTFVTTTPLEVVETGKPTWHRWLSPSGQYLDVHGTEDNTDHTDGIPHHEYLLVSPERPDT